jgi:medium-chain acyl-CoA synthetase
VKGLRIGRRRARNELPSSPLELALRKALVDGRWQIPDRFNFTRDVVETLARDPKRRALTFLGSDGVIEHRSFMEVAEGAAVWATALRERSVSSGDRVIVMAGTTVDWLEAVLGTWKIGGVVVPCAPSTTSSQLERVVSSTDAVIVVAERSLEQTVERMGFSTEVHLFDEGTKRNSKEVPTNVPSHDSASRDLAFIVSTSGAGGARKDVAHTHASIFATRVQAEHWLDVGRGDAVWCTSPATSPLTIWNTVVGPWSRGAEVVLQQGAFDADERLDLLFRLGPSILCQSPAEYRALAEHPKLERFRSPRLRRLVSTGDFLDPEVVAVFEERWGMSIADGYGQAETNIVVANLADGAVKPGSCGRALPGHHVAVIDDQGNELPAGIEGDLAVRGRPPTLFAGYWELPEETKSAFLGDWYLTGDVAHVDEDGYFTFVGRAEDVISSSGRTFGPYDVERVLDGHPAIAATAVVGIRDLQRGGHFVRAFVVAKGDGGSEQLEAELRQFASQTLPTQQVPREIVFVDELPAVAWKISRHELRERPLGGRPLWEIEMPPTTGEDAPSPAPPPLDGEFSPRIEEPSAAELPVAFVYEPEPEPIAVEPVIEQFVEPVVEPTVEPIAEPEPAEPEPVVVEQLVEPAPAIEPEPVVEPEPVAAEASPAFEPEPLEPLSEPEPESLHEPEPIMAEAALVPEPVVEEIAPEPQQAEPEQPALVVLPEPVPEPAESTPEPEPDEVEAYSALESPALPDYVIDEPEEAPPVVAPEPEPEPDLSGPLPEFVVEPTADSAPPPAPHVEPDPEEEEDLGPLPDYVIDPSKPRPVRPVPPPPAPEPRPILEARAPEPVDETTPSQAAGLYFPPVTAFPTPRGDRDEEARESRRSARPRPSAEPGKSKRSTEPAEPGDEAIEAGWMDGLSNRLSAYSLSEDETPPADDSDDDETT